METPDALQIADVAQRKTSAIVQAYQSDLLDLSTARKELQALDAETGLFGRLPDELAKEGKGVTATSTRSMLDPMAGIFNAEPEPEPEPLPAEEGGGD
jgi:hypothetical protein